MCIKMESVRFLEMIHPTHFFHLLFETGEHLIAFCQCFLKFFKPFRIEGELRTQEQTDQFQKLHAGKLNEHTTCFNAN